MNEIIINHEPDTTNEDVINNLFVQKESEQMKQTIIDDPEPADKPETNENLLATTDISEILLDNLSMPHMPRTTEKQPPEINENLLATDISEILLDNPSMPHMPRTTENEFVDFNVSVT